jgi:RNA polymerase sigma-70 factor, ECF subfamily
MESTLWSTRGQTAERSPVPHVSVDELFRRHAPFVWKNLFRLGVAERDLPDVLQEVFVVAQRRRDTFDGTSSSTTWLFAIASRVASNYRREARHRRESLVSEIPEHGGAQSPEHDLEVAKLRIHLHRALAELPDELRTAFVMFEVEELSCRQIADEFQIPIGTVYSRIHSARRRLAELLPPGIAPKELP